MKTYLLVDGTNLFVRSYAAIPALNSYGQPFGGVIGFLQGLRLFVEKTAPDKVIIAWDGKGGSQRRRKIIKEYKKGRRPKEPKRNYDFEKVEPKKNRAYQRISLSEYLNLLPVYQTIIRNVEADDVIAYLCNYYEEDRKVVISTDKDYYQLLNKKTVIYSPTKKVFVNSKACLEEFGIHPNNFALAKAIVGDNSDNIKGIRGVGFKKLTKDFSFLNESKIYNVDDLLEMCTDKSKKYEKYTKGRDIIIRNLEAIQLSETLLSATSISKIKSSLSKDLCFNATQFRVKLLRDGVTNIGNNFFESFKFLNIRGNVE